MSATELNRNDNSNGAVFAHLTLRQQFADVRLNADQLRPDSQQTPVLKGLDPQPTLSAALARRLEMRRFFRDFLNLCDRRMAIYQPLNKQQF